MLRNWTVKKAVTERPTGTPDTKARPWKCSGRMTVWPSYQECPTWPNYASSYFTIRLDKGFSTICSLPTVRLGSNQTPPGKIRNHPKIRPVMNSSRRIDPISMLELCLGLCIHEDTASSILAQIASFHPNARFEVKIADFNLKFETP